MAQITLKGTPVQTRGSLPTVGSSAPDFRLTLNDMTDVSLADFPDRKKILNIVPSLDTGVCAASAKQFENRIAERGDTVVLTISNDLPFAQKRFCNESNITRVVTASQMRNRNFGVAYQVEMIDGPLQGLLSRAIVVLDEDNTVLYTEQVPEIGQEPDYDKALSAL